MKKKSLSMILVLLALVAVAGYGKPKVFDKSVPAEQCSTLIVESSDSALGTQITKFNEKKVSWNPGTNMLIPAGTHSLQFLRKEQRQILVLKTTLSDSTDVTHTFLAGHTYLALAKIIDDSDKTHKAYVKIQDVTEAYLDFPMPDRASPDASPFEGEWVGVKGGNLVFAGGEWAIKADGKFFIRGLVWEGTPASPFMVWLISYDAKKNKWKEELGGSMPGRFYAKIISNGDDALTTITGISIEDINSGFIMGKIDYQRAK